MDDGIPIGLPILYLLCLVGSFFFSATEMAFSSVSRIRMRGYADAGNGRAARVVSILDHYDRALTTLLIGNNICNIGMATIATVVATRLWGAGSVAVATLVTTVLLFVLGETVPKVFAKAVSERYTMATAGPIAFLMKALGPLVSLFTAVTNAISRPLRRGKAHPTVTEAELRDIIDDAVEEGGLGEETGELVQSLVRYGDTTVRDILTPWKQVEKLSASLTPGEVIARVQRTHHSRLPVVGDMGEVLGLLRVRKYLRATLRGKAPASPAEVMDPVESIPVEMSLDALLPMLSSHKTHFALVRDEWDNILGVITIEDILECIVGDIWDEDDIVLSKEGAAL